MGGAQAGTSPPQRLLTPGVSWPRMGQQSAPAKVKGPLRPPSLLTPAAETEGSQYYTGTSLVAQMVKNPPAHSAEGPFSGCGASRPLFSQAP